VIGVVIVTAGLRAFDLKRSLPQKFKRVGWGDPPVPKKKFKRV
jgi:hypothetical protein